MADEGNETRTRRMDLNLYLGLPRSPRPQSLDLGSDLALSSLPLSSSSNTEESRAPTEMSGAVDPSDSHAPYSPSHASFTSTLPPVDTITSADGNSNQEYTPYFPSFESYAPPYVTVMPEPELPTAHYSPSAVITLPTVHETDESAPYEMVAPTDIADVPPLTRGNESSHAPYSPPPYVPVSTAPRADEEETFNLFVDRDVGGPSSQHDLFESPEFRFRRLIESNTRSRLRRFRSSLPFGSERGSVGLPTSSASEQLVLDLLSSQRPLESNGKHKVLPEIIATESSEEDAEEKSRSAANFECNICLEMAKEPVVTSCGHLFCWPCLFQWLHIHSEHKECPVCKGEVTESNVTPIYGRGNTESTDEKKLAESGESGLKIPPRPRGNRYESLRQQFRPISRRLGEGIAHSWRRLVNQQMRNRNRFDGHGDPSLQGMLNGGHHTVLTRLRARRMLREETIPDTGPNAEEIRVPRDSSAIYERNDAGPLFRDGIDLWHRFSVYGIASSDRLAALTADLRRVVGSGNRYGASTSSINPPSPEQLIPRPNVAAVSAADQASASSTTAVIQGDVGIPDTSAEQNVAGSSRSYRRRGRSSVSGSLDVDGGVHPRKRRRLN